MQIIWKSEEHIVNNMFNQYWRSLYLAHYEMGPRWPVHVLCSSRQFVLSAPLIRQTFSISSFSHGTPRSIVSPLTLSLWNPTSAGQPLHCCSMEPNKIQSYKHNKIFPSPKNSAVVAKLSRTKEYFKHCLFDDIIPMRGEQEQWWALTFSNISERDISLTRGREDRSSQEKALPRPSGVQGIRSWAGGVLSSPAQSRGSRPCSNTLSPLRFVDNQVIWKYIEPNQHI